MRRFKFYSRGNDNPRGQQVLDDVFEDYVDAWKGLCASMNLEYSPHLVRTMIARGYYCTSEVLS